MPRVPGPVEEHDLPLRARNLPDVRRQDVRVPHLSQDGGEAHPLVLVNKTAIKTKQPPLEGYILSFYCRGLS